MLLELHIRDLAIITSQRLELKPGMTALTGETGAGKSILVDALGLALGDKTDNSMIRNNAQRAEITAVFDCENIEDVQSWVAENELDSDTLVLRRLLVRDGKSRAYINDRPVSISTLQDIGGRLIDILGQHAHQSLMRTNQQRHLLDRYAGHQQLATEISDIYREYRNTATEIDKLEEAGRQHFERVELLNYQIDELETNAISREQLDEIDAEHNRLAHAERLITALNDVTHTLTEQQGAVESTLSHTVALLDELTSLDTQLAGPLEMLNSALIQVQEAAAELRRHADGLSVDPAQLEELAQRLQLLHDLSRKYRVKPEELNNKLQALKEELEQLEHADQYTDKQRAKLEKLHKKYFKLAARLRKQRLSAARQLSDSVTEHMQQLGMEGGMFDIRVVRQDDDTPRHAWGTEDIEMRVSANPGQSAEALNKVASGGELSRISLAIQVSTITSNPIPTLIFDEVDVGIGGGIAEVVGQLLRRLGEAHQVLTVTHLPQVAAQGHHHLMVSKLKGDNETRTQVTELDKGNRVEEIARMLGGLEITEQTLAHAREMIERAQSA